MKKKERQRIKRASKLLVSALMTGALSLSPQAMADNGFSSLKEAVNSEIAEKVYDMSGTELLNDDLGVLGGTTLTINGNGNIIDAQKHKGIITQAANQVLTINNATIKNFTTTDGTYDAFIYNDNATVNINGSTFTNNSENKYHNVIFNRWGNINIKDSIFSANSIVSISLLDVYL